MSSPNSISRLIAKATIPVALLGALTLQTAPALAQAPEAVQLSADGVNYSRSLDTVFGPLSLVPRDSVTEQFWVQNAGKSAAYLTIEVTDSNVSDPDLRGALSIAAGPAASDSVELPVPAPGTCTTLHAGTMLESRQEVRIASQLGLADLNGTQGQGTPIGFKLRVILSDQKLGEVGQRCASVSVSTDAVESGGEPSEKEAGAKTAFDKALALTGSDAERFVTAAALLAALGFVIVALRRRRSRED